MRYLKRFLCLTLLAGLLSGCTAAPAPTEETSAPIQETTAETTESLTGVDALLAEMTLRQKVGQLFLIRPEALDPEGLTEVTDAARDALAEYPVGGIVLFSKNIVSPEQLTAFNAALQEASAIPLFLSVDEEGGQITRLANHSAFDLPTYQSAAAVGEGGDPSAALEMGRTIGAYLTQYGFNMDFAPVADVNTNPDNPVIGTRAFSSDPEVAAQMAAAMADGLRDEGVIAVFKHFPGHGDTAEDSHNGIAVSDKTEAELRQCEWLPFLEADSGDLIMVGHIALPEITGDLTPASLSYAVVTEILKERLGFQGLVITDALEMGAVTDGCTPGQTAVAALEAGCDLLLMPQDLPEAFDAVLAALEDGTLTTEWLDATVRRILEFKQLHGIL